jgi:transposase
MPHFKEMPVSPGQIYLFPVSVDESVPDDCDVRILNEVMESLDWRELESSYSEIGCPPYPPRVLAKILAYAYSRGVRSSRKIEDLVKNDRRYIWLAGGLEPDHNTLARFRHDKWHELSNLYADSVRVCLEAGLVFLNVVSADGSRIPAQSSKRAMYCKSKLDREMERVEQILREAEEADRAEDELEGIAGGRDVPSDLKDPVKRKAKLEEIARRLRDGKRRMVSATEPDARMMKTRNGNRPCYSLEAAVDAENHVIVGMHVTQAENDHGQVPKLVEEVEANTGLSPDVVLADSGMSDEGTMKWLKEREQEALIPPLEQAQGRKRRDLFCSKCFLPDHQKDVLICPAGRDLTFTSEIKVGGGTYRAYDAHDCRSCSFHGVCVKGRNNRRVLISVVHEERERMREKLSTPEGKEQYALRKQTVETVFGQIKANFGFDRLLLRGVEGATAEISLICMVHNLVKCGRKAGIALPLALRRGIYDLLSVYRLSTRWLRRPRSGWTPNPAVF